MRTETASQISPASFQAYINDVRPKHFYTLTDPMQAIDESLQNVEWYDRLQALETAVFQINEKTAEILKLSHGIKNLYVLANAQLHDIMQLHQVFSTIELSELQVDYQKNALDGKVTKAFLEKLLVHLMLRIDFKSQVFYENTQQEQQICSMVLMVLEQLKTTTYEEITTNSILDTTLAVFKNLVVQNLQISGRDKGNVFVTFIEPKKELMIELSIPSAQSTQIPTQCPLSLGSIGKYKLTAKKLGSKNVEVRRQHGYHAKSASNVKSSLTDEPEGIFKFDIDDRSSSDCQQMIFDFQPLQLCQSWSLTDCAKSMFELLTTDKYDAQLNLTLYDVAQQKQAQKKSAKATEAA